MNMLSKNLYNVVNDVVNKFIQQVSDEHDIDVDSLRRLWETLIESKEQTTPVNSRTASNASTLGCPYKYIKGAKKNETCGVKPKSGSTYCATHKKYENGEQKPRKVLPEPKKTINPKKKSGSPPAKKTNPIFRKHPRLGKLFHQESGMVIVSATDRRVCGCLRDDKICPLEEKDMETIKKWGFVVAPVENKSEEKSESDNEEPVVHEKFVSKALGVNDNDDEDDESEESVSELSESELESD